MPNRGLFQGQGSVFLDGPKTFQAYFGIAMCLSLSSNPGCISPYVNGNPDGPRIFQIPAIVDPGSRVVDSWVPPKWIPWKFVDSEFVQWILDFTLWIPDSKASHFQDPGFCVPSHRAIVLRHMKLCKYLMGDQYPLYDKRCL